MKLSVMALFVSLISFSSLACTTYEAQFIGKITSVETDSMMTCKAKFTAVSTTYKREQFTISVGDELPTGIVQLAKVYIAQKRKLKENPLHATLPHATKRALTLQVVWKR